jgi:hypothetical protein
VNRRQAWGLVGYVVAWLLLAAAFSVTIFLSSSVATTVASHDAVIRPTLDGWVTLHTGPYLPDVRARSEERVGVDIALGKTEAGSTEAVVQRYAFLASHPDAQIARVQGTVRGMAYDAALRGGVAALLPLGLWALVGRVRRHELLTHAWQHRVLVAAGLAVVITLGVLVWEPWENHDPMFASGDDWQPLDSYLTGVHLPDEARGVEVTADQTTDESRRLLLSAVDTYRLSKDFYADATSTAAGLRLRQPLEGETVALLVSDRHDNIGMDQVARAIAEQGGATAILDAGDDTSTGAEWETFSLDSLDAAFRDFDRYAVSGNHDHGSFVRSWLRDRGWVTAVGEPVEGPGGSRFLAFDDPRSSGLGNWRDVVGLTVDELAVIIADEACAADERVGTLLVHDADMGTVALQRGCVDLVLSGHLHTQIGPDRVVGSSGETGYAYTNGTTGGAAYAIAVGSKLRRPAEVTLVTYRDGRPVGLQPVTIQTTGTFMVSPWVPLTY